MWFAITDIRNKLSIHKWGVHKNTVEYLYNDILCSWTRKEKDAHLVLGNRGLIHNRPNLSLRTTKIAGLTRNLKTIERYQSGQQVKGQSPG